MKKVITGASSLLTGALLFLSTFVAASNTGLLSDAWWNPGSGRFWTAVSEAKLIPVLVISIVVMVVGTAVMIWGNCQKSD